MAQMIKSALEPNECNSQGSAVTLYWIGKPSKEELKQAFEHTKLILRVDVDDDDYAVDFHEDSLSKLFGLVRVQGHPTC